MSNLKMMVKVCERARNMGVAQGNGITQLMDMECADKAFDMDWEGLLNADGVNFVHDFCGIQNNINRQRFNETHEIDFNLFLPRYAK